MQYKSFRIQNFKGIKDTTISLQTFAGACIFALVGLNESGKTTILEAIHSFAPDRATGELIGGEEGIGIGVPINDRVPRHLLSTFTGDVSVTATLSLTDTDKAEILNKAKTDLSLDINPVMFPSEIRIERHHRFESGDWKANLLSLRSSFQVRAKRERRWRAMTYDEREQIKSLIYRLTPLVAYFPTFVFDFPERIFLTNRGGTVDRFYRRVFQDILDYDAQGHLIEQDIVRRVREEGMVVPWVQFLATWLGHENRPKVQHVMDRAGAAVTRLVFGRWNRIFHEDVGGKEIVIAYETVEGETEDARGAKTKTQEHDVYVTFQIRDGTRRFNVNDRSLGFRWFFAFMLFTQFRVARSDSRPVLFLFDEPASNLHAAAQQKLIECFPGIARDEHALAYSTHSHYMVEPRWLEQTFVVTNRADTPSKSILDNLSLDDESLDVKATAYRDFVNAHPTQTSYFQPILDRLEVVPSRFDIQLSSVIVEGKSDYYVLRYAALAAGKGGLPLLPCVGAGTFGALVSLHLGWSLKCLFLLDGDKQGKIEQARYTRECAIPPDRIITLDSLISGIEVIEDLVDKEAKSLIQQELSLAADPTKNQLRRFFQERLASNNVKDLGKGFMKKSIELLSALEQKLES